jgi:hypothetical protein
MMAFIEYLQITLNKSLMKHYLTLLLSASALLASVLMLNNSSDSEGLAAEVNENEIFEMRTYTTHDGKLDALHQRFENHTMAFFEKHGMTNIAYWVPEDPELKENTLIYILSHESPEAAEASWNAFRADPDWQRAYEESHADGVIVKHIESVYMTQVSYSPMK